jgi:hypothetical protein
MTIRDEGLDWIVDGQELSMENERIVCTCDYSEKCGIPCSHVIKVIVLIHEDVRNYIHDRWKIDLKNEEDKYEISKGRPRISRRR